MGSLRLFTPAKYGALPSSPFLLARNDYPTKDDIADYLAEYAAVKKLPVRMDNAPRRVT